MKQFHNRILLVVSFVAGICISACSNKNNSPATLVADSVVVDTVAADSVPVALAQDDSIAAPTDAAVEEASSKALDEQEIQSLVSRSLDNEACFSAEYIRLMNKAAQVSEAGLWNVLPGSIYEPTGITINSLNIQSTASAVAKATLTAQDFEDASDKQVLKVRLTLIKEHGKWVIDDVDDTKHDFRECIRNAAE